MVKSCLLQLTLLLKTSSEKLASPEWEMSPRDVPFQLFLSPLCCKYSLIRLGSSLTISASNFSWSSSEAFQACLIIGFSLQMLGRLRDFLELSMLLLMLFSSLVRVRPRSNFSSRSAVMPPLPLAFTMLDQVVRVPPSSSANTLISSQFCADIFHTQFAIRVTTLDQIYSIKSVTKARHGCQVFVSSFLLPQSFVLNINEDKLVID